MMSEAMQDKMKEAMEKIGVKDEMMSEELTWGFKKAMYGGYKIMKALKEKGVSDEKAMEIMKKFSDLLMSEEMMSQMEQMKDDWKMHK